MKEIINIAIDGPSGSGKSTLAKGLSKHYGYVYIDTGALYRTIGLYVMRKNVDGTNEEAVVPLLSEINISMEFKDGAGCVFLNGELIGDEIRVPLCSICASNVSKLKPVRDFLLDLQRDIAKRNNVIMDGRDIGTVILPNADVKLFLRAKDDERARRRYNELKEKGSDITFEEVLKDMSWRDENDSKRDIAPAVPADDAIFLDNSGMTREETLAEAIKIIDKVISEK